MTHPSASSVTHPAHPQPPPPLSTCPHSPFCPLFRGVLLPSHSFACSKLAKSRALQFNSTAPCSLFIFHLILHYFFYPVSFFFVFFVFPIFERWWACVYLALHWIPCNVIYMFLHLIQNIKKGISCLITKKKNLMISVWYHTTIS